MPTVFKHSHQRWSPDLPHSQHGVVEFPPDSVVADRWPTLVLGWQDIRYELRRQARDTEEDLFE